MSQFLQMSSLGCWPPKNWQYLEKNHKNNEKMCNRQLLMSYVWFQKKNSDPNSHHPPKNILAVKPPVQQIWPTATHENTLRTWVAFAIRSTIVWQLLMMKAALMLSPPSRQLSITMMPRYPMLKCCGTWWDHGSSIERNRIDLMLSGWNIGIRKQAPKTICARGSKDAPYLISDD